MNIKHSYSYSPVPTLGSVQQWRVWPSTDDCEMSRDQ